jgi:hypothetical protein
MSIAPQMPASRASRGRAITPLPSLLRASAHDAANMAMRKAGRTAWSEDDYNVACETQERLIRACYGSPRDHNDPNRCYIRFGVAEQMERAGQINLSSDINEIHRLIDEALA